MSDGNDFDDEFVVVEKQTTEKKTIPTPRRRKENEAEEEARTRKVIPRPRKDEGENFGERDDRERDRRTTLSSSASEEDQETRRCPPTPPPSPRLEEEEEEEKEVKMYVPPPPPLPSPPPMPPSPPPPLPPPLPTSLPANLTLTQHHENAHHYAASMAAAAAAMSFGDMRLSASPASSSSSQSMMMGGHSYRHQQQQHGREGGKEQHVEVAQHMQPPPNTPKPPNQHWSLDYSSHYVVTGERPQNFIIDPQGIPTPALQKLVDLKSELINAHAHVPLSVKIESAKTCELTSENLGTFDVVVINPDWSKMNWRDVARLDLNAVTSDKAFVFLWIGKGDGRMHENALKIMKAWKFRRCAEEIVWVKTGLDRTESSLTPSSSPASSSASRRSVASGSVGAVGTPPYASPSSSSMSPSSPSTPSTPSSASSSSSPSSFRSRTSTSIASTMSHLSTLSEDGEGMNEEEFPFTLHKEHCMIAAKAKVTRKEAQLIHANVDADVIISPPLQGNQKPDQIYAIAERFVQGLRRLNLFGDSQLLRPGWVTVSENVYRTTHNPITYRKAFEGTRVSGKFEAQYQRRANRAMMQQQQQYNQYTQYQSPQSSMTPQYQQQQQQQVQRERQTYTYRHKSGSSPQSSPQRVSRPAHLLPHDEDITRLRPKSRSPSKSSGGKGGNVGGVSGGTGTGGGQFSSYEEYEYAADKYYSPRTSPSGPMFSHYTPPPTFYPQQHQYPYVSQQYIHALQHQQQQHHQLQQQYQFGYKEQQQQQQYYYEGTNFTSPPGSSSGPA